MAAVVAAAEATGTGETGAAWPLTPRSATSSARKAESWVLPRGAKATSRAASVEAPPPPGGPPQIPKRGSLQVTGPFHG